MAAANLVARFESKLEAQGARFEAKLDAQRWLIGGGFAALGILIAVLRLLG